MAKLYKIEPLVQQALETNPASRGDDFILILEVLSSFVTTEMSLESVFENHVLLGIPSLESITRCRRKLQEKCPELRNESVAEIRQAEMNDYIQYSTE